MYILVTSLKIISDERFYSGKLWPLSAALNCHQSGASSLLQTLRLHWNIRVWHRNQILKKLTTETSASSQKPNNVCWESDSSVLKYVLWPGICVVCWESLSKTECDLVSDTNKVSNEDRNYLGRNVGKDTAWLVCFCNSELQYILYRHSKRKRTAGIRLNSSWDSGHNTSHSRE